MNNVVRLLEANKMNVSRQLEYLNIKRFIQLRPQQCRSRVTSLPTQHFTTTTSTTTALTLRNGTACIENNKFLLFKFCKLVFQRQPRFVSSFSTQVPFDIKRNVSKDILIFSHENESFYKFITFFGVVQMIMWGYLSLSPVQNLKSGPVSASSNSNSADLPWWKRWLYKEGLYKNAITGICLTVGTSILFVTLTYPQRAIKNLWLLKGGKNIKITTYSQFRKSQSFSVPLNLVNCLQSRTGSGTQIPLKIKDKNFFFLMDKQGTFHNPEMFDFVVGLKRNV